MPLLSLADVSIYSPPNYATKSSPSLLLNYHSSGSKSALFAAITIGTFVRPCTFSIYSRNGVSASKLSRQSTAHTSRKPSPERMYASLNACCVEDVEHDRPVFRIYLFPVEIFNCWVIAFDKLIVHETSSDSSFSNARRAN